MEIHLVCTGNIILGRRNGHSRMHGSMAALQNESGPLFSSCPGANIGGGRRSPAQRRRRGGQEIGWSTRPGGLCRPVPNVYRHWAGRLAPASPGTGRVVVFFQVPFPASGSTRASESPLSRRDNIAASCSFQRPSRASSLFPPLPSHLSASTLAPAAHDQRHLVHFGNFTFFFI